MFSLRARCVFPVDRPPLEGGYVTVDGPRIVAVGTSPPGGEVRDLGDVALLPGLVNAHTHLEYSLLTQPLGRAGMPFPDWIREVMEHKRLLKAGDRQNTAAISAGLRESLRHGVTTLGEIASPGWSVEPFDGYPGAATIFQELIGIGKERIGEAISNARDHLARATSSNPLPSRERAVGQQAEASQQLAAQPPGEGAGAFSIFDFRLPNGSDGRLRLGLSPHAPYSVHPELLSKAVALACETQTPLAMHLAESREELELLRTGGGPFRDLLMELGVWRPGIFSPGRRPLDYLQALSAAPRSGVIDGNYLDEEEIAFVAGQAERMAVVYCPRTHQYFRHDEHPLPKLLAAGGLAALGTDGRGSNPDLSLLAEMRHVARRFPELPPETILRLGTLDGSRALGLEEQSGSLTPGKQADLVAVPLAPQGRQTADLYGWLESDREVSWTMVRGVTLN